MKRTVVVSLVAVIALTACVSLALAVKCAKCGAEAPEGAKFCPQCGAVIEQEPTQCAKCGAELPKGAKFCPECGAKVERAQTAGAAASRQGAKQRYDGIFPVGLYTSVTGPPNEEATAEEVRAWRQEFLTTVKDLGFNTIAGDLQSDMIALAAGIGLYAIVGPGFHKALDVAGLTEGASREAVAKLAALCDQHDNIVAGFLYADPVKPNWLQTWQVLGKVWNESHPDVPLLATYGSAEQWKQFDSAAPIGAAQGWCYVFKAGVSTDEALQSPVCKHVHCGDARQVMPGLPVWAWMPGILNGWNQREPTIAEMKALYYSAVAEGIRGCILFPFAPPRPDGTRFVADENCKPVELLLDMKPMLHNVARMGTELLPYEVDDDALVEVQGNAAVGVYADAQGAARYLMVANKDVRAVQTVVVKFRSAPLAVAGLKDFLDGTTINVRMEGDVAVCEVDVEPAAGRLLSVVPRQ